MTNIKFGYTAAGTYTLTGSDYEGYYNVTESNGDFTASTNKESGVELTKLSTFYGDVTSSSLHFDRVASDIFSLPYVLNDILVGPNEFVTTQSVNSILKKLYDNNVFLYSKLIAYKGNIPENVVFYSGFTNALSATPTWIPPTFTETYNFSTDTIEVPGYEDIVFIGADTYRALDDVTTIETLLSDDELTFSIIGCTETMFITLTGDFNDRSFDIWKQTTYVDDINNDIEYNSISDTCRVGKFMYVCDNGADLIYKYDVSGLLAGGERILIEAIGGHGVGRDKNKFDGPKFLTGTKDSIYVWDAGNNFFKHYDLNFNHISSFRRVNSFKEEVICVGFNTFFKYLYVVTQKDQIYYIYTLDSTNKHMVVDKRPLDILWESDKVFKKIIFSENDSNIFYIVTNKYVYKKLTNRPDKTIGRFSYDKMFLIKKPIWNYTFTAYNKCFFTWNYGGDASNQMDFNGMSINSSTRDGDMLFIAKRGRFYGCFEPNSYDRVIFCENYSNYGISSVEVTADEYVQGNNFNKELYKVVRDLNVLTQNLVGRFDGDFDQVDTQAETTDAGVYRIKGYKYIKDAPVSIDDYDTYVHENENITPSTINRCIRNIYAIQEDALNRVIPDPTELIPYIATNNTLVLE